MAVLRLVLNIAALLKLERVALVLLLVAPLFRVAVYLIFLEPMRITVPIGTVPIRCNNGLRILLIYTVYLQILRMVYAARLEILLFVGHTLPALAGWNMTRVKQCAAALRLRKRI